MKITKKEFFILAEHYGTDKRMVHSAVVVSKIEGQGVFLKLSSPTLSGISDFEKTMLTFSSRENAENYIKTKIEKEHANMIVNMDIKAMSIDEYHSQEYIFFCRVKGIDRIKMDRCIDDI